MSSKLFAIIVVLCHSNDISSAPLKDYVFLSKPSAVCITAIFVIDLEYVIFYSPFLSGIHFHYSSNDQFASHCIWLCYHNKGLYLHDASACVLLLAWKYVSGPASPKGNYNRLDEFNSLLLGFFVSRKGPWGTCGDALSNSVSLGHR